MCTERTRLHRLARFLRMGAALAVLMTSLLAGSLRAAPQDKRILILTGLGGLPEYEENFEKWAAQLEKNFAGQDAASVQRIDGRTVRRKGILKAFEDVAASSSPASEIWLFLVGHGTYDGYNYKFNIRGPDLTGKDLLDFLNKVGPARVFVIAATGASGFLAHRLEGPNRVIVTATKSAHERQPPLFLSFFLEAAASAEADTNRDGKISLLEAYTFSVGKVAGWFKEKGRIQTEHALLEDRGKVSLGEKKDGDNDPQATGAGLLASVAYLSAPPQKAYRNLEARRLAGQKSALEREIEDLKFRKEKLSEAQYFQQLQALLVKLAKLNQRIEELEGGQ